MANAFDQFDANPFDAFDSKQAAPDAEAIKKSMMMRSMVGASFPILGDYLPDVAMGARQVLDGAAQMGARGLEGMTSPDSAIGKWAREQRQSTEDTNAAALADYQKTYQPDQQLGSSVARGAGQAVATAPLMAMKPAAGLAGMALQGGAYGGASGALMPVYDPSNFWAQKGDQAKEGAIAGAMASPVVGALGKVLSPAVSPAVKTLMDAGVTPTPGQISGGMLGSVENKLTSVPLVGDVIKSGQTRALNDFNRAVYSRTLEPLGDEGAKVAATAPIGNKGVGQIQDYLSQKYNDVLPKITVKTDPAFLQANADLQNMASNLPQQQADQFNNILKNQVYGKFTDSGLMAGETMKQVESQLGSISRGYSGQFQDFDKQQLGAAVKQLQSNLRELVARSSPENAPAVQAINQSYANLTQLENAAAMKGAPNGVFTPSQYLSAVKKSDLSVRDRQYAAGNARNQDLAQAGTNVLGNYPDSGTAGRSLMAFALGGGGATLAASHPLGIAGAAASSLAYTPAGQRVIAGLLGKRPDIANQLGGLTKLAAPYLGAAAPGLLGSSPYQ